LDRWIDRFVEWIFPYVIGIAMMLLLPTMLVILVWFWLDLLGVM